jgi:hypothetical protein
LKQLKEFGRNINEKRNDTGNTPFMEAIMEGKVILSFSTSNVIFENNLIEFNVKLIEIVLKINHVQQIFRNFNLIMQILIII